LRIGYSNGVVFTNICKTLLIMEILMSHSDYEYSIDLPSVSDIEFRIKSRNNRAFLKQPLSIEMFVPCKLVDGFWVVLEEPIDNTCENCNHKQDFDICCRFEEYQKAKESCLFEGFIFYKDDNESFSLDLINSDGSETFCFMKNETIEDLLGFDYYFKLTATALKQIGL